MLSANCNHCKGIDQRLNIFALGSPQGPKTHNDKTIYFDASSGLRPVHSIQYLFV